jgi:DNA repair exonuclease SbcCD ATPase subunit
VNLVRKGDYVAGRVMLIKARNAHENRRDVLSRRGMNPESDPREDMFVYNCDQLLAFWDVRARLSSAGFNLDAQSPAQVLDSLLANQQRLETAVKNLNTALDVEKAKDQSAAIKDLTEQRRQAEAKWEQAEQALKSARGDLAKKQSELAAQEKQAADVLAKARDRESTAQKALEEVAAARRSVDASMKAIRERLVKAKVVGEGSTTDDVVKALDTLISLGAASREKDAEIARLKTAIEKQPVPPTVSRLIEPAARNPLLAEKLLEEGLQFHFDRDFLAAETQLSEAIRHDNQDARSHYFLGLSRWRLGKTEQAEADFQRASQLERQGKTDPTVVNTLLERVQGQERQALDRYR